ncbi:Conserved_hypothetical protein [Hexamita inflata]|uniref:Uncharacterized protein n=1 Tax=Hexamita inflata TaxID=28002 RepID=A0AA86PZP8_9EUKA|nr:Conserved hypothetical protein [Hexamita inflata]
MDPVQKARLEQKIREQNEKLLANVIIAGKDVHGPLGLPVPADKLNYYLLAHQLNTGSRLRQTRGKVHQRSCTRIDYMCNNYENCPFFMIQCNYVAFPKLSYLQIKKPHIHCGDPKAEFKHELHGEITKFIREFRGKFNVNELRNELELFVRQSLNMKDLVSDQHRRQFPQNMLQVIQNVDLDEILPSKSSLYKRISYFRRQEKMFADGFRQEMGVVIDDPEEISEQKDKDKNQMPDKIKPLNINIDLKNKALNEKMDDSDGDYVAEEVQQDSYVGEYSSSVSHSENEQNEESDEKDENNTKKNINAQSPDNNVKSPKISQQLKLNDNQIALGNELTNVIPAIKNTRQNINELLTNEEVAILNRFQNDIAEIQQESQKIPEDKLQLLKMVCSSINEFQ